MSGTVPNAPPAAGPGFRPAVPPAVPPGARSATQTGTRPGASAELRAFVARLHFYVGLFVGPFLLAAAVTGVLYVLTPQIEAALYAPQLRAPAAGEARSLAAQAGAARLAAGPEAQLFAVRPAPEPGQTTRVLFADPRLGESETRAIFVDPVTLAVRGDLTAYGTSGILPFRTALDHLHRSLMLGEAGRLYSELAASWLWVLALGGMLLWGWRRTGRLARANPRNDRLRTRRRHGLLGVALSLGLLFLSVTGLTWSRWAGGRIDDLRAGLGWVTPSVSTSLDAPEPQAAGGHAHHAQAAPVQVPLPEATARLDEVLAAARAAGIDSAMVEIRLPRPGRAWLVREYDRSWPTQVDTLALDPRTLRVTGRADFADFPLVAKLIRWGIDLHMGVLFGVASQVLVAALGVGLIGTILFGYRIWWQNRPAPGAPPRTLVQAWLLLPGPVRLAAAAVLAAMGWALPALGLSLLAFLLVDLARWHLARRRLARSAPRAVPAE